MLRLASTIEARWLLLLPEKCEEDVSEKCEDVPDLKELWDGSSSLSKGTPLQILFLASASAIERPEANVMVRCPLSELASPSRVSFDSSVSPTFMSKAAIWAVDGRFRDSIDSRIVIFTSAPEPVV